MAGSAGSWAARWWRRHWRGPAAVLAGLAGLALVAFGPTGIAMGTHGVMQLRADRQAAAQDYLGTEVRDGPAAFVVHKIQCGPVPQSIFGKLCEVTIRARNDGAQELTVPGSAQLLHSSEGARHWPAGGDPAPFGALAPGEAAIATLTFDLPPRSTVTHVEVHAGPYTGGHPVAIGGPPLPLLAAGD